MPSDRARKSFDDAQRYGNVIQQQGRVTLEADWNEQRALDDADEEAFLADIIGPTGTPDDGFKVGPPTTAKAYDFAVGSGTMYVGGARAFLPHPAPIRYFSQPDWLTVPQTVLDFVLNTPVPAPKLELIALWLQESEVSATEDPSLKDPALGGPDTAQRSRLLERIVRFQVAKDDCELAWTDVLDQLKRKGWTIDDPHTMLLHSMSGLEVGFTDNGKTEDCEPAATGGYLEADNQFIRVTVADAPVSGGGAAKPRLLWGYDNASFLYQVLVNPLNGAKITLAQDPPDTFRRPRLGQAVEVLLSGAQLDGGFAAAPTGVVRTVASYDPDSRILTLDAALGAEYVTAAHQIYVRIWEGFSADDDLTKIFTLGTTGLTVKLNNKPLHNGDTWTFAARPATPTQVLPERYTAGFQPPEEPRIRLCSLAVIEWNTKGEITNITDCRDQFDNLVDLTRRKCCCCTVEVGKGIGRYATIQAALTAALKKAPPELPIKVCIHPGDHKIAATINVPRSDVIFSGCGPATRVIVEAADNSTNFTAFNATANGFVIEELSLTRKNTGLAPGTAVPLIVVVGGAEASIQNTEIANEAGLSILAYGVTGMSICGNTLTKGDGLLIQGDSINITGNTLHGGPRIVVGPPCSHVRISDNEIIDAADDGAVIFPDTLLIPGVDTSGWSRSRVDIEIANNKIRKAACSGITTRPDKDGKAAIPIYDLRIINNLIEGNVLNPPRPGSGAIAISPPFGGIILSSVALFEARNNRILGNGQHTPVPICGIFLGRSRGADIRHNTIRDNGQSDDIILFGQQGGIILRRASQAAAVSGLIPAGNLPAAVIRDNTVDAPRGQAVRVFGIGEIVVSDNALVSRRMVSHEGDPNILDVAGTAMIFDLGLPTYFFALLSVLGYMAPVGVTTLNGTTNFLSSLRGQVQFSDNEVTLDLAPDTTTNAPLVSASIAIFTMDDVNFAGNQTAATMDDKRFLFSDTFNLGATVRSCGNGLTETAFQAVFSMVSCAALMQTMTSNQGTHCLRGIGPSGRNTNQSNLVLLPDPEICPQG